MKQLGITLPGLTLALVALAAGLLFGAEITTWVSDTSRWGVLTVGSFLGIAVADRGDALELGGLILPWTPDCSGINSLVLLLLVTVWVHREALLTRSTLIRLAACVPLALVVNIFRVLLIASYRYWAYPNWETPALHYFIGFVCLLPTVLFLVPDWRSRPTAFWIELLYLATVVALIAPLLLVPGGPIVVVCAVALMMHSRYQLPTSRSGALMLAGWGGAGLLVSLTQMEGFWVLWLLVSPAFVPPHQYRQPFFWLLALGTVPVVAMQPIGWGICGLGLALYLYQSKGEEKKPSTNLSGSSRWTLVMPVLLLMPLGLGAAMNRDFVPQPPPLGVMSRKVAHNTFQVKTIGQSDQLASFWFGPFGDGRHHSLKSCAEFRGLTLESIGEQSNLYQGDGKWMVEFFIQDGRLITSYPAYLLATLMPMSSPGIHLIFEADVKAMGADYFADQSQRIAQQLASATLASES